MVDAFDFSFGEKKKKRAGFDSGVGQKNIKSQQVLTQEQEIWCWENSSQTCDICGKTISKFSEAKFNNANNLMDVKITHKSCDKIKRKKSQNKKPK